MNDDIQDLKREVDEHRRDLWDLDTKMRDLETQLDRVDRQLRALRADLAQSVSDLHTMFKERPQ